MHLWRLPAIRERERADLMDMQHYVASLYRQYGTDDLFELSSALNITILFVELPQGIDGFFLSISEEPFIFLNENLEGKQRKIICAHELGHALLHPRLNSHFLKEKTYFLQERYEREADEFCACLLLRDLPEELKLRDCVTIGEIADITGLPEELIRKKFHSS